MKPSRVLVGEAHWLDWTAGDRRPPCSMGGMEMRLLNAIQLMAPVTVLAYGLFVHATAEAQSGHSPMNISPRGAIDVRGDEDARMVTVTATHAQGHTLRTLTVGQKPPTPWIVDHWIGNAELVELGQAGRINESDLECNFNAEVVNGILSNGYGCTFPVPVNACDQICRPVRVVLRTYGRLQGPSPQYRLPHRHEACIHVFRSDDPDTSADESLAVSSTYNWNCGFSSGVSFSPTPAASETPSSLTPTPTPTPITTVSHLLYQGAGNQCVEWVTGQTLTMLMGLEGYVWHAPMTVTLDDPAATMCETHNTNTSEYCSVYGTASQVVDDVPTLVAPLGLIFQKVCVVSDEPSWEMRVGVSE